MIEKRKSNGENCQVWFCVKILVEASETIIIHMSCIKLPCKNSIVYTKLQLYFWVWLFSRSNFGYNRVIIQPPDQGPNILTNKRWYLPSHKINILLQNDVNIIKLQSVHCSTACYTFSWGAWQLQVGSQSVSMWANQHFINFQRTDEDEKSYLRKISRNWK